MKNRFSTSIFFLSTIAFLMVLISLPVSFAHAQYVPNIADLNKQSVLVDVSPENPQPGDIITYNVSSFLSDLDKSTFVWTVNGVKAKSGLGLKTFSTPMSPVGRSTQVNLTITTNDGTVITRDFTYTGASVDLIWEAQSYTPPMYKGKALFTPYEVVKIVAVPNLGKPSSSLSPTNLIYTWTKDGRVLGSLSGYGKNTLFIDRDTTALKSFAIGVTVSDQQNSVNITKEITLSPSQPKLLTYISNPAYGTLFNTAIQNQISIATKEISFVAIPYFFDTNESSLPFLAYSWSMNNNTIPTEINNIFTVRNEGTTTGITNISASVNNNIGSQVQRDTSSFSLSF